MAEPQVLAQITDSLIVIQWLLLLGIYTDLLWRR